MGRREDGRGQFFYSLISTWRSIRSSGAQIDCLLGCRGLAPYYSHTGRPSIDAVLTTRMLLVGYRRSASPGCRPDEAIHGRRGGRTGPEVPAKRPQNREAGNLAVSIKSRSVPENFVIVGS
jgi:hypothetical protein